MLELQPSKVRAPSPENFAGKMSAPLDQPSLPFDDTWIQEIKVCVLQPFLRLFMYFTITIVHRFFESKLCVSL